MSDLSTDARYEGTRYLNANIDPDSIKWNIDKCVSPKGHVFDVIAPLDRSDPCGTQMVDCQRLGCHAVGTAKYREDGV